MRVFSVFFHVSFIYILFTSVFFQTVNAANLSQGTAATLQRALKLQQEEKFEVAVMVISNAPTPTEYDKAYIQQVLGVFYWQKGDVKKAQEALKRALGYGVLENALHFSVERMLADILLTDHRYNEAVFHYLRLLENRNMSLSEETGIWLRIASGYFHLKEYTKAMMAVSQHLALTDSPLQGLSLKVAIEQKRKAWKSVIHTLKQIISLEPSKKTWWIQLISAYQQNKDSRSMLETLVVSQRFGISLSKSEKMLLAHLYAKEGVPEKAATVLSELNKTHPTALRLRQESQYWINAKEWDKALIKMEKSADLNPVYTWSLAQLQLQLGFYDDALKTLAKVKPNQKEKADVEMAFVMAYEKTGNVERALLHARNALKISPTTQTKNWIKYLEQKTAK